MYHIIWNYVAGYDVEKLR